MNIARLPLSLTLGFALLGVAFLVPNHYLPWSAFHSEVVAAFGLLLVAGTLLVAARGPIEWPWLGIVLLALAAIPWLQFALGLLHFHGDAWIVSLYLLAAALSVVCGDLMVRRDDHAAVFAVFWSALALASIVSVGVALYQWLGLSGLGTLAMDKPPGGRPYGNLAQPNHLATLLLVGLVAALGLHQLRLVQRPALALLSLFLLFGAAMTQSRTAWLGVALLVGWILVARDRAALRLQRAEALTIGGVFLLFVAAWPYVCDALYMSSARTLGDTAQGGTRPTHWSSMLDAMMREPWFGYGWNQVSVAQARVAADHPFTGEFIEHSHNLLLDLLVWNGVPLGTLLIAALAWWAWRQVRACRDPEVAWLLAGVAIVTAHAMLEFPLEFTYFLIPVGLMMGAIQARSPIGASMRLPRTATLSLALVASVMLVWTSVEYLTLEESMQRLRLKSASIGDPEMVYEVPDVNLLTQLRAYQQFARTEASIGMSQAELDRMRDVAERFQYPPVLFRYALASALNGQPDAARGALLRLCKLHPPARCAEGIEAWGAMASERYPQLRAVRVPALTTATPH